MGAFDFFFKAAGLKKTNRSRTYKEEYSTELYNEVFNSTANMPPYNSYIENGIEVSQSSNPIRLLYDGLLARSGAQEIYAVVGYGNNFKWENVQYYPMSKVGNQTFEVLFPIRSSGNINIAFKDGADNWDNNSGNNYIFTNHFKEDSH